jgi:hypothetical protein
MIQGRASYAKILGSAPPGYDNGPAEWTFDLVLDEKGLKDYLASGGDNFYVKTNKETGEQYIRFKRFALKKDGTPSKPILVVGPDGKEWDQKTLIGNDSILNVRFGLNEITHKKDKRLKPSVLAVQVWEHKKYEGKGFPTKVEPEIEEWETE